MGPHGRHRSDLRPRADRRRPRHVDGGHKGQRPRAPDVARGLGRSARRGPTTFPSHEGDDCDRWCWWPACDGCSVLRRDSDTRGPARHVHGCGLVGRRAGGREPGRRRVRLPADALGAGRPGVAGFDPCRPRGHRRRRRGARLLLPPGHAQGPCAGGVVLGRRRRHHPPRGCSRPPSPSRPPWSGWLRRLRPRHRGNRPRTTSRNGPAPTPRRSRSATCLSQRLGPGVELRSTTTTRPASDRTQFGIDLTQQYPPGEAWSYNNAAIQTLDRVISEATGPSPPTTPVSGCSRPLAWSTPRCRPATRTGRPPRVSSGSARPRGHGRFGSLFLREGTWDGEEIVPSAWVEEPPALLPGPQLGLRVPVVAEPQGTILSPLQGWRQQAAPARAGRRAIAPGCPRRPVHREGLGGQIIRWIRVRRPWWSAWAPVRRRSHRRVPGAPDPPASSRRPWSSRSGHDLSPPPFVRRAPGGAGCMLA